MKFIRKGGLVHFRLVLSQSEIWKTRAYCSEW